MIAVSKPAAPPVSAFEGPPTASDMKRIARDLLQLGKYDRLWRLAETMLDYWQRLDDCTTFGWWLGISAAATELEHAKNRRALARIRNRTPRSV